MQKLVRQNLLLAWLLHNTWNIVVYMNNKHRRVIDEFNEI